MRHRWWLASLVLAGIVGAGLWELPDRNGGAGDVDARAASDAARIGLPLPQGTRAEFAEWMAGIDAAARLALVMPEAGWESIRAGLPAQSFEARNNSFFGPDGRGWRPGHAPGLVSAHFLWGGGKEAVLLGVAPAGHGEVRVFVFWHQL